MVWISGALVHWRAHTERIIIPSTAAGEYVALSKGNTTGKFIRDILKFYDNNSPTYLYTNNQAAEHIATQPTMNEHSRSIDTRHHAIRQDYVDGDMRIGGVASSDNESDILIKFLQPPLHQKHTTTTHHTKNAHDINHKLRRTSYLKIRPSSHHTCTSTPSPHSVEATVAEPIYDGESSGDTAHEPGQPPEHQQASAGDSTPRTPKIPY
jgi:hypothetical protein